MEQKLKHQNFLGRLLYSRGKKMRMSFSVVAF